MRGERKNQEEVYKRDGGKGSGDKSSNVGLGPKGTHDGSKNGHKQK